MSELLPKKEELLPILEVEGTFSHCPFVKEFDKLSFLDKLQTVNDIIRQTMIFNETPNPLEDEKTMEGDCHTAALVAISYLKELNLGKNHQYIWLDKKSYDPSDMPSDRFAVVVEDENGEKYLFDATPKIGYRYGKVRKLKDEKVFTGYKPLSKEKIDTIFKLRQIIYNQQKNSELESCIKFVNNIDCVKNQEYITLVANCYKTFANMDKSKYNYYMEKALKLNPYININNPENIKDVVKKSERDVLLFKQIDKWIDLLMGFNKNKTDFVFSLIPSKQIEVAQNILGELIKIDKTIEPKFMIEGKEVYATQITPRWCSENKFNVVMIKPSAYSIGLEKEITKKILSKTDGEYYSYSTNLGEERPLTAIRPLNFSHSIGMCVERQMTGPSDIYLVRGNPEEIKKEKKKLRNEYGGNLYNTEQIWLDGEKILWEKWSTNLLHSTDNAVEAGLHFLIAYPEYQIMTRFMYPNPKLTIQEKEAKKEEYHNQNEKLQQNQIKERIK